MQGIATVLLFCVWVGGTLTSLFIIVFNLIQWLTAQGNDKHPLKTHFWAALAFFVLTELFALRNRLPEIAPVTEMVHIPENLFLSILGFLAALFVLSVIFLFVLFVCKQFVCILKSFLTYKMVSDQIQKKATALLLTIGIILMYFLLPISVAPATSVDFPNKWSSGVKILAQFLPVGSDSSKSDPDSQLTSKDNIDQPTPGDNIGQPAAGHNNTVTFNDMIRYTLLYVIILGVSFAAIKIIYTIVQNALIQEGPTIWNQYSSAIGLLTVSIAILWSAQKIDWNTKSNNYGKIVGQFITSLVLALFVVTIVILVLETINLLIDLQKKLIKKEGKLIFVYLVGQITLLLLYFIQSLAEAVEGALNIAERNRISQFMEMQEEKVILYMEEELEDEMIDEAYLFPRFHEKVTKK